MSEKKTPNETALRPAVPSSDELDGGGLDAADAYCRWRLGFFVYWRCKIEDKLRRVFAD